ncbi:MAG: Rieske 2Fe-2S domain-containing protein [Ktedonobacteraceae bacterium]|nr:Rieske 2Fe-2S domain-containing protein [Ktedonobacteraceae bacterium]
MSTNISGERRSWVETPPKTPVIRKVVGEMISSQSWLDKLADPVQNWVRAIYGPPGQSLRTTVKNVLNGVWLGHPLHPVITDIPIGSWTATMLLDAMWLVNADDGVAKAADATLILGLAGAGAAAVAGITDWSDTDGPDRRVGLVHGALNVGVTGLNLASFLCRRSGMRGTGILLSTAGYLVTMYSSNLGGELSFAKGVGVNHVAWEGGSDDFVTVMNAEDLPENKLTRVDAAGIPAVLLKQGKNIYAIAATCSHLGGPLDEGEVHDCAVTCPWHGSTFDMTDGSVINGPAVYAQPTFAARVRQGKIELRRLVHA